MNSNTITRTCWTLKLTSSLIVDHWLAHTRTHVRFHPAIFKHQFSPIAKSIYGCHINIWQSSWKEHNLVRIYLKSIKKSYIAMIRCIELCQHCISFQNVHFCVSDRLVYICVADGAIRCFLRSSRSQMPQKKGSKRPEHINCSIFKRTSRQSDRAHGSLVRWRKKYEKESKTQFIDVCSCPWWEYNLKTVQASRECGARKCFSRCNIGLTNRFQLKKQKNNNNNAKLGAYGGSIIDIRSIRHPSLIGSQISD